MKKISILLLSAALILSLFACSSEDVTCYTDDHYNSMQTESDDKPATAEADGFSVTLPAIVSENCIFTSEENRLIFTMKDGGDWVGDLIMCNESNYPDEFWTLKMLEQDGQIVYATFPTCGTLNNEKIRELLNEVTEAIKGETVTLK